VKKKIEFVLICAINCLGYLIRDLGKYTAIGTFVLFVCGLTSLIGVGIGLTMLLAGYIIVNILEKRTLSLFFDPDIREFCREMGIDLGKKE
jgi:hypothetical protein